MSSGNSYQHILEAGIVPLFSIAGNAKAGNQCTEHDRPRPTPSPQLRARTISCYILLPDKTKTKIV